MCGFAGFTFCDTGLIESMKLSLKVRAIDKDYVHIEEKLSFYHAHLQIADLDKDTSQPLLYKDLVIGLVGEIYNKQYLLDKVSLGLNASEYSELRVIALCYEKLGEKFINFVNGEFSVFIFDRKRDKYFLFRDRWGTNLFYYTIKDNQLFFSTEIKSLVFSDPVINKNSFIQYLIFQFSLSPDTIIQGIYSLRPGTYIEYGQEGYIIKDFDTYEFTEDTSIIYSIENAVKRRIPDFQKRLFVSLSGGPDSNLILYFLTKYYKGEIIAYSFFTDKNIQEIEIAKQNTDLLGIQHLFINMNEYIIPDVPQNLYSHEGLVCLPDIHKILRQQYPQFSDIKVEFGGDGKEELFLTNTHYNYEKIIGKYRYFRERNMIRELKIDQAFLNKEMFDFNLQLIDKLTLRNGFERRLPYTDYELLRFLKYSGYRGEVESFLRQQSLKIVEGEWGYNLGIGFSYLSEKQLLENTKVLFKKFSENILL